MFASESLAQTLRQLDAYGRDGLPVLSGDGSQVQGWITNASVLQAVAAEIGSSPPQAPPGRRPAPAAGRRRRTAHPAARLPGPGGHHRRGLARRRHTLGAIAWPQGCTPVSVLRHRTLGEPDPGLTLAPGDRVSLLAPVKAAPASPTVSHGRGSRPDGQSGPAPRARRGTASAPGAQP